MTSFSVRVAILLGGIASSSVCLADHDYDAEFAYQQIKALQAENSGIIEFDMRFALVAMSVHRYDEAIFALERVLTAQPHNGRARTELARCYYETGQYHLARTLFEQVKNNTDTPRTVQHNINYYLHDMDQRGSQFELQSQFYVEAGLGRDNNINAGSDLSSIDIPNLGNVALSDASLAQDSTTQQLAAGAKLYKATSKFKGWSLQADLQQINTPDDENYDQGLMSVMGSYHWRKGNDRYRAGLQYQQLQLGGEEFFNSLGLAAQWHKTISERMVTGLTLQWHDVDFGITHQFRDHDRVVLGGDLLVGTGQWRHQLGSFVGVERPSNPQFDYALRDAMWGLNYRLSYMFNAKLVPYLAAQYVSSDYGDTHPIFALQRHDSQRNIEAGVIWQAAKGLTINPSFSDTQNDSNIDAYSYDRDRAQVKLRYNF